MTTQPATWWALTLAAWPLWFALGAVLIVGNAENLSRAIDHALPRLALRWLRVRYGLRVQSCSCTEPRCTGWGMVTDRYLSTHDVARIKAVLTRSGALG